MTKQKHPGGRPSVMTDEVRSAICEKITEGLTIREICADEAMPAASTVYRTLGLDEGFSEQYARAKAAQAEAMADELLEIVDDATNDWMKRHSDDGEDNGWQVNGEHIQRSRLRVDTRKWLMSKMLPKKYGDKVQHAGADGEGLVVEIVKRTYDTAHKPTG